MGEPALPENLMETLRDSYGKFRKRQLYASSLLLLIGAGMLAGSIFVSDQTTQEGVGPASFLRYCGIAFLLAWMMAVFLITRNASLRKRVVEALENDSSSLVWFYLEDIRVEAGISAALALRPHFNLADGTHAWFQVPRKRAQLMYEHLAQHRTDLSLGYSRELKRRFRKDPRSLAEAPERSGEVLRRSLNYIRAGWR